MLSLSIKAPAKLNLFLHVLDRRRDGYHNIQSLFERINLFDNIKITKRNDNKIVLSCTSAQVPKGRDNLVYKAACLLRRKFKIRQGVNISISKKIPVAAGLGGGSSDAAATILGLNQLWKLKLGKNKLFEVAISIGCDVSFFVSESSFCLATGRGEALRQLKTDIRLWHILVVLDVSLSTRRVYNQFDRLRASHSKRTLTKQDKDVNMFTPLENSNKEKGTSLMGLVRSLTKLGSSRRLSRLVAVDYNSLETIATFFAPEISKIRQTLHSLGVKSVGMSGSGPSVFGILHSRKEGVYLKEQLARFKDWRTFIVRTF